MGKLNVQAEKVYSQVKSIWAEINKLIHGYLFACVFLENSSFTNLFVYFSTYMRNSYNWTVLF